MAKGTPSSGPSAQSDAQKSAKKRARSDDEDNLSQNVTSSKSANRHAKDILSALLPQDQEINFLTFNVNGHKPHKWKYITQLSAYKSLDIILLTEYHLSTRFRPQEIVNSGWSVHAVPGPPKTGPNKFNYRGGLALLVRDSSNLKVKQNVIVSGTTGSVHQAATWTLTSPLLMHPFHITGVYVSPSDGKTVEEFFDSLSQNHSHPVEEVHIYAGDMNAHIAQEVENHLSTWAAPIPLRVGDVEHSPSPAHMDPISTSRPTSSQRGRLLLRFLNNTQHVVLNGRYQSLTDPIPYTLQRNDEKTINDYNTISINHFSKVKRCTVNPRNMRNTRSGQKIPSDHNPILLELTLPTRNAQSQEAPSPTDQSSLPPRLLFHSSRLKGNTNHLKLFTEALEANSHKITKDIKTLKTKVQQKNR